MAKTAKKNTDFEKNAERLDEIISEMENPGATLGQSLALYKEGVSLAVNMTEAIDAAEKEVMELKESADGIFSLKPFDERENGEKT